MPRPCRPVSGLNPRGGETRGRQVDTGPGLDPSFGRGKKFEKAAPCREKHGCKACSIFFPDIIRKVAFLRPLFASTASRSLRILLMKFPECRFVATRMNCRYFPAVRSVVGKLPRRLFCGPTPKNEKKTASGGISKWLRCAPAFSDQRRRAARSCRFSRFRLGPNAAPISSPADKSAQTHVLFSPVLFLPYDGQIGAATTPLTLL